jgi:eukaryotic-like serine/threonine-protein kinase
MLGNILRSHYRIVKVLGIGKSGTTYLAKDLDLIDSPLYVVKEVQAGANSAMLPALAEQLFEIQGSIVYRIGQHPQIPALVAKFAENGHRYLVRTYIEGEFLNQELQMDSTWSQIQVFDFLVDLVGILAFVHSFKYIHQDINPHNIIRRDDDGRFNLIGFSSIKDLENTWYNIPADRFHNLDNSSYIPYEQEQNISQFNSDIYAVGAIAIQALTGKFPLDRDSDSYELKWRNDVKIDNKLIKIIDRMVRPDYRNRYQSALDVLQDLQSFALTQIPSSQSDRLKPLLIVTVCTLLMGFGVMKLLSAAANKPQPSPPKVIATKILPATTTSPEVGWKIYADKIARIKIKYATTWHLTNLHNIVTGENATFTSPKQNSVDRYQENVSIRVESLTNPQTTLSSYTKSAIAEIKKYDRGAKMIESSPTILAKKPAILVVYTGKDDNLLPIKNLEVWTINRGKVYILTYKAEPDRYYQLLGTAMTTIDSLELK